jgi:hypothetical protein
MSINFGTQTKERPTAFYINAYEAKMFSNTATVYYEVRLGSSRNYQDAGEWKKKYSTFGFVHFVGKAAEKFTQLQSTIDKALLPNDGKKGGYAIEVLNGNVTHEGYTKDGKMEYAKSPKITVFDFQPFVFKDKDGNPVTPKSEPGSGDVDNMPPTNGEDIPF